MQIFGKVVLSKVISKEAAVNYFNNVTFDDSTLPEFYPNILPPITEINVKPFPADMISNILISGKSKSHCMIYYYLNHYDYLNFFAKFLPIIFDFRILAKAQPRGW